MIAGRMTMSKMGPRGTADGHVTAAYSLIEQHQGYRRNGLQLPAGAIYGLVLEPQLAEVSPLFTAAILGQNPVNTDCTYVGPVQNARLPHIEQPLSGSLFMVDMQGPPTELPTGHQDRMHIITERIMSLAIDLSRLPSLLLERPFDGMPRS